MKTVFIFLSFLLFSQISQARTHLDLNEGTIQYCKGAKGETNAIAFHAKITTSKKSDGGLQVNVSTEFAQCLMDASGNKSWSTLTNPEASNYFGQIKFSHLQLMLSTEVGELISLTALNLEDTQTLELSPARMKNLRGRFLQLGALVHQDFYVDGSLQDSSDQFYGSYLISHL